MGLKAEKQYVMKNKRFASTGYTLSSTPSSNDGHKHTPRARRMKILRFMCTAIWVLVATFEATASPHVVPIDAAKKIAADFLGDVEIVKKSAPQVTRALPGED